MLKEVCSASCDALQNELSKPVFSIFDVNIIVDDLTIAVFIISRCRRRARDLQNSPRSYIKKTKNVFEINHACEFNFLITFGPKQRVTRMLRNEISALP